MTFSKKHFLIGLSLPLLALPIVTVASCSSESSLTSSTNDVEQATKRIMEELSWSAKSFSGSSPSSVNDNQINLLFVSKPSLNLGFKSEIKTTENDDENGLKKVQITLSRGSETKTIEHTISGFATKAQIDADKDLKPEDYFNVKSKSDHFINLETKKADAIIPKYITETRLKNEYINLDVIKNSSDKYSVFKKELPADVSFEISNIVQESIFGLKMPSVLADIQLVKGDKKSSIFQIRIGGFVQEFINFQKDLNNNIRLFNEIGKFISDSSSSPSPSNAYINKKASQVTKEELEKYLQKDALISLVGIVENSANDSEGSLIGEFNFTNPIDKNQTKTALIKIYGFNPN